MNNFPSNRDLVWGFAAQGLSIGLWLVMLPVVLRYLPPQQVGLWLVFITMASLAQLLELGFQPTVSRNVSYIHAGAASLLPSGIDSNTTGPLNKNMLAELLAASRYIYRVMAALGTLVMWVGGSAYLISVMPDDQNISTVMWAWLSFSAGYIVNFYYGYLNAFLQGRGDMLLSNKVVVASRVVQLLVGVILIFCGMGLLGLGLASISSTVVGRAMAYRYVFGVGRGTVLTNAVSLEKKRTMIKMLWHNASRYGIVMVGAFLITRANILIASSRIGLVEAAGFSLALQILLIMQSIATLPFNLALPRLNLMRAQGITNSMRSVFGSALVAALTLFALAGVALVILGNPMLRFIGSTTTLPSATILSVLCIVVFLELNHGICANLLTTDNQVPFVKAALFTGIGIASSAWLVAPAFGVLGLLLSMAVWQLAYNNWKWPIEAARVMGASYWQVLGDGFMQLTHKRIEQSLR